jgi:hypothetical protein
MSFGYSKSPDFGTVVNAIIDSRLAQVHVALPGEIVKYNPNTQVADVRPLVKDFTITIDDEELLDEIPIIPNVPIVFPRAGDFFISMPLQVGHKVLLIFNERSVSNYVEGDGNTVVEPEERTRHSYDDAVAFAGFYPTGDPVKGAEGKTIVLGKSGAAKEPVAMADKVKEQLDALQSSLSSLVDAFNVHVHATSGVGAPSAPFAVLGVIPVSSPSAISKVGSKSVEVTE